MHIKSLKNDQSLHDAFIEISKQNRSNYIHEIVYLVIESKLNRKNIQIVLSKYSIKDIGIIKNELLDVLIEYSNIVLRDNVLSETEKTNFEFLKLYFGIKEGDFYKNKRLEIKNILNKQFEKLYDDNLITHLEAEHNFILQEMFDLNYDQFDILKEDIIIKAIEKGAEITNLDTANKNILNKKNKFKFWKKQ
ncbi:MAG: hypothetical protein PHQ01_04275 [Candidatus Pacebacteria bacterium]|nr:hypothetical protein [Candidatus Paceibacterota bacterium]